MRACGSVISYGLYDCPVVFFTLHCLSQGWTQLCNYKRWSVGNTEVHGVAQ
jgi:hypothetical protein